MFRFLIKKSFFNQWDNMLTTILLNIGFLLCIFIILGALLVIKPVRMLPIVSTAVPGFIILHLYTGLAAFVIRKMLETGSVRLKDFKHGFLKSWKKSIIIACFNMLILLLSVISIPFYLFTGSYFGIIASTLVLCIVILWLCSAQYFFPLLFNTEQSLSSVIKTSVMFAAENYLYSFGVLLVSAFLIFISIITFLFIPGISAVLLLQINALKLRLYKYEWYEQQDDKSKKSVPWAQLLEDEQRNLGKRSLKGMFFPWKD